MAALSWKDALALYRLVRGRPGALTPEERRTMVSAQVALQGRCCGQAMPLTPAALDEVLRIGRKALAHARAHGLAVQGVSPDADE